MKKIITFFIVLFLIIMNSLPAYANTNIMLDTNTVSELKEDEELILESVNRILDSYISTPVNSNDIDYNKAIKVHIDTDILNKGELNNMQMREYMDNTEYIYYLPIYLNDESICCTIVKGQEVSKETMNFLEEEDYERLSTLVGKWYVAQIDILPNRVDYKNDIVSFIENNTLKDSNVYFVGGISGNIPLVAVICSEDSILQFKVIDIFNSNDDEVVGEIGDKDEKLYSYEELKLIASDYKLASNETGSFSDNNFANENIMLIVLSIFIILTLVGILVYNKYYKGVTYEH